MINEKSTSVQDNLSTHWPGRVRAVWYSVAVLALVIVILAIPGYIQAVPGGFSVIQFAVNPSPVVFAINTLSAVISFATVLLCFYLSFLLFRRRANDRMALFLSFYLLAFGVLTGPLEFLGRFVAASFTSFVWNVNVILFQMIIFTASCFLFALFPDGRFALGWSRRVAMASLITAPLMMIGFLVWSRSDPRPLAALIIASVPPVVVMIGVLYALFFRYRHLASGQQRQQIKWVVYGLGIMLFIQVATSFPYYWSFTLPTDTPYPVWLALTTALYFLSFAAFPISLTIAVLRYRLYDIDIIINRTLVYGVLTAVTMAIYVIVVGFLGNLFQNLENAFVAFLTTGLIALLFSPLRERLQRIINRIIYGERNNPVFVITKLGKQLEDTVSPHEALSKIVETIAQTLKLPYVAIEFGAGKEANVIASYGQPSEDLIQYPIIYQTQKIGCLVVAPESPRESFSEEDIILLENIARQAGTAAQAAKLTADLQRSRQRLVTAREEERRRLRRDLHDDIGPTMAGQTLKLDAAIDLILGDPESGQEQNLEEAIDLLTDMKEQTQNSVKNIRNIVYELRPPSLDDLGLVPAIQAHMDHLLISKKGLSITVEQSPQVIPRLSAAVELAAYRIVLEALTNVIKHSQAKECTVKIIILESQPRILKLEIFDNGKGLPKNNQAGIGLPSMRERAEELGGSFSIRNSKNKGTHVIAKIPLDSLE